MIIDIKRAVSSSRKVYISHVHDMQVWYVTEFDESFPVPLSDIGAATLNYEEKALLMMRYMRKWNETVNEKG